MATDAAPTWHKSACILCECNCGIEIQLGGEDGRRFTRIRGDKSHPGSQGYACEKANRLDHYQNGLDRITQPLRRRSDGTFEAVDWDTAIREVASRLAQIRDEHGGERIFYYGGGGQGNHFPAVYSASTMSVLGNRYRSNALAQEKTGEFWVNGRMLGTGIRGDFEHCEVAFFLGKNPWMSHGVERARVVLREISKDPNRKMVVVDPRRSESADLADFHLAPNPGTDAWLMAALIAVILQEGWADAEFLRDRTVGGEEVWPHFESIDVADYCRKAGVEEALVRETAKVLSEASSVSFFEDLGVQMNRNSTLVSYLNRLLQAITGSFGKKGAMNAPLPFNSITSGSGGARKGKPPVTPVAGSRIITGLVAANAITDEILTDHPDRFRAMFIDSANPVHSLADSARMREALRSLEFVVVVDVAMTETAREADYVLPMATQFEKAEATFFNYDFPKNVFFLRKPILKAPDGVITEAELHARLVEELGEMPTEVVEKLRGAWAEGREAFAQCFFSEVFPNRSLMSKISVILYRALGDALGDAATGAPLWGLSQMFAAQHGDVLRRAGFEGEGIELGDKLFDAIIESPTGVLFADDPPEESWKRLRGGEGRIHLAVPDLFDWLDGLKDDEPIGPTSEFPFILSAGERREFTANTIYRDPAWRKKGFSGALRVSPGDAGNLGVEDGSTVRVSTRSGSAEVVVEVSDRMRNGHISLPNGLGLLNATDEGNQMVGVAPNELTAREDCDEFAGTPWHKSVPARLERVAT